MDNNFEYDFNNFANQNERSADKSVDETGRVSNDFIGEKQQNPQPTLTPEPTYSNAYTYERAYGGNAQQNLYSAQSNKSTGTESSYGSTQSANAYNPYSQYQVSDFNGTDNRKKKEKKSKKGLGVVAAVCAVMLASGGAFYAGVTYNASTSQSNGGAAQATASNVATANTVAVTDDGTEISSTITQVVEEAMPSMVSINTITQTTMNDAYSYFYNYMFGDDYNQTYETTASGSGIIIGQNDEELLIATNNHVVEDSTSIAVEFIDGESYDATIKGTSADNDLAVISVKLSDISSDTLSKIKVATLGNSDNLKLGEPAIAIGNSLGYGQSVTVGYISAKERKVQITDKTMTLIQTDAAINPGNSGGALLNIKGEVIGINSAKYSDTSVEGTGYAIPISYAAPIINDLMNSTYISDDEKPYLGIYGQSVPDSYKERFGWPAGVYVGQIVSDSPASLAGLEQGDIITAINGEAVTTMEELQAELEKYAVGDKVQLSVTRSENGSLKETTLTATLIARGDVEGQTSQGSQSSDIDRR